MAGILRPLLAAAALLASVQSALRAGDSGVQRYLDHVRLGLSLAQVQRLRPPAQPWPSYLEPRGHVERFRVERSYLDSRTHLAKLDPHVETMWLGFKRDKLVEIQYIYDAAYSRAKPADALARDWAIIYGEPRRTDDGRYWWGGGGAVLSIFYAEVPVLQEEGQTTELRTSIRLAEEGIFESVD